jgi:GDP-4-dehydro-6-deoxy-D-mannose reductase
VSVRALVTGAAGFVGRQLRVALDDRGMSNLGVDLVPRTPIRALDLSDRRAVRAALEETRPEIVYHLAGLRDEDDPAAMDRVHVGTTRVLLEELGGMGLSPTFVVAGSAAQYGVRTGSPRPLTERSALRPASLYGVSKVAQEMTALVLGRRYRINVVAVRLFNIVGPGQGLGFVVPDLVAACRAALRDGADTLPVREASSLRDYVDVRDVAQAFCGLAERDVPTGPYNIASGRGVSTADLARTIVRDHQAEDRLRVLDATQGGLVPPASWSVGSSQRLHRAIGWSATHDLADSVGAYLAGL